MATLAALELLRSKKCVNFLLSALALGSRVSFERPLRDAPVDQSRHNTSQPAVALPVMAEHLRQHLKLVHLRQTMLDDDPVLRQVRVVRFLLRSQRLAPTRFVWQIAGMRWPVLIGLLGIQRLEAVVAFVEHDALRPVQAVQ